MFICCNNGKLFCVASLFTTNSPGVNIAGTVSVPFGLKSIYLPVLAYTMPPLAKVLGLACCFGFETLSTAPNSQLTKNWWSGNAPYRLPVK